MPDDDLRQRIESELTKVALGETPLRGRSLAAQVSALNSIERLTREPPDPEPIQTRDHPCDELGRFSPPYPEWWTLWRQRPGFDYEPGSEREAQVIATWEHEGHRADWLLSGRPFSRSEWESDRQLWRKALEAVAYCAGGSSSVTSGRVSS